VRYAHGSETTSFFGKMVSVLPPLGTVCGVEPALKFKLKNGLGNNG